MSEVARHSQEGREHRISTIADLAVMAGVFALGIGIAVPSVDLGLVGALGIGPGLFPFVCGSLLAVLGGVGTLARLAKLRTHLVLPRIVKPGGLEAESFTVVLWPRVLCAALLIAGFVAVAPLLGFVSSLSLFVLGMMLLVARRSWWVSLIIAVATGVATYVGFGMLLGVVLPRAQLLGWLP